MVARKTGGSGTRPYEDPGGSTRAGGYTGPAHHERGGGGWEHLVLAGCQGWLGCAFGVGCYWVPAGDAGMVVGAGWEGWVLGPVVGHGTPRTPCRLTTNGVVRHGPVGTPARLTTNGWVTGGGGSTRAGGYTGPAHHERIGEDGRVGDPRLRMRGGGEVVDGLGD